MFSADTMTRATIFVDHIDDSAAFDLVIGWLERWKDSVRVEDYSTGGWEHMWDVEGPDDALSELPAEYLCSSTWTKL